MGNWDVIATIAIFGVSNAGLLLFLLGGMKQGQADQDRRIDECGKRLDGHDKDIKFLVTDVAKIQGEMQV